MQTRVQQVDDVPDEIPVARLKTISYEALREVQAVK